MWPLRLTVFCATVFVCGALNRGGKAKSTKPDDKCKTGTICGYDCGTAPVKLETMEFQKPDLTFPSKLTGTIVAVLNTNQQKLLLESRTRLSVDDNTFADQEFCETFPTLCTVLKDELKFFCEDTKTHHKGDNSITYRCSHTPQVVLPEAPNIEAKTYKTVKFEVVHPTSGVLQCVMLQNVNIVKGEKKKRSVEFQNPFFRLH